MANANQLKRKPNTYSLGGLKKKDIGASSDANLDCEVFDLTIK
ncbi:MAG: hypothetical protein O8C65_15210 [Candidatus Methanoperedens sp.]|nr:hypothetical protein [Candidatus Methanoperedens sp.]